MWPYTECEWNFITHKSKKENKLEKFKILVLASILPSIILSSILYILFA